jgi:FtsP/CotA-like multicopper oxidase with cupredoxin domain
VFAFSSCFDFFDDGGGGKKETFQNPEEISSVNGVLDTTLVVDFAEFRIGNRRVTARVYNGSFTPPTFRVFPGDLIRIRLENLIDQMTSLHTHGLNVSPLSPGDNIFIMITPNSAFDYEIQLPDEHPEGTFYYHFIRLN